MNKSLCCCFIEYYFLILNFAIYSTEIMCVCSGICFGLEHPLFADWADYITFYFWGRAEAPSSKTLILCIQEFIFFMNFYEITIKRMSQRDDKINILTPLAIPIWEICGNSIHSISLRT